MPVSVKTRLGYSRIDEWREWLAHILQQDIATLTIHLRTKKEMSKVPAHWELIPEIKALRDEIAPGTLLVINGDVKNKQEGLALAAKYGVDGIMIGRGIFADPFAFQTHATSAESAAGHKAHLIALLQYHLDEYDKYAPQTGRPFDTLKRFFKIYIRDFDGASDLRAALMLTRSTSEVRELLAAHPAGDTI